jgi:hypothetical protein
MAEGDKSAPIFKELFGKDNRAAESRGGAAGDGASAGAAFGEGHSVAPPLHRMHETRLVRNAGRMAAGRTMAAPQSAQTNLQVFSTGPEKSGASVLLRTAVAMTCVMALGSAVALTNILRSRDASGPSAPQAADAGAAMDAAAAQPEPDERPLIAVAQPLPPRQRVASLSPVIAIPPGATAPGFVRVAQKDAPELEATNIFGPAGKPIRLPVSLKNARSDEYSFLMFRGLPQKVTLSAGFRLKESWAVSLRDIDNLTLEAPNDYQGAFSLEILLIKGRDTPAESKIIAVEIVSQDIQLPPTASLGQVQPGPQLLTAAPRAVEPERPAPVVAKPQPNPAPAPARNGRLTIPVADEQVMMQRAEALLHNNDVSSARLLFEHLARSGSARAALAMGKTFDPAFLNTIDAAGLKPDIAKARVWYRQAAELGDQEAAGRLSALASR